MIDREAIDVAMVRRLIDTQFPQWADLPVRPVDISGWDNRTFRLGDTMSVRLPSAEGYREQVEKEQRWLPILAPQLPLPIPAPVAMGAPGEGYPWTWSVNRWLEGENATTTSIRDMTEFAVDLARFLRALNSLDTTEGPPAGQHSFFRGGDLAVYDAETRRSLDALEGVIDVAAATEVWERALAAPFTGPPVWLHGDVASGNLLVKNGRLHAVIDYGQLCVGDPACDTVIAWTLLRDESRRAFRDALPYDDATWARGRGWALWKALITLVPVVDDPIEAAGRHEVINEVLGDAGFGS